MNSQKKTSPRTISPKTKKTSPSQLPQKLSKQSIRRARRPPPLFTKEQYETLLSKPKTFSKKNDVLYNLKHMSIKQINKIFDELKRENIDFTFDCKVLASFHGRDIVQINSINGKPLETDLFFYKSSGVSRMDKSIKDIWFPCGEKCVSPSSQRITKAEDKFLLNDMMLESQLNSETNSYKPEDNIPHLTRYGRFINKQNAFISKMLGEGFDAKCKA